MSYVLHKHIFHMMLVKLCMLFNGGPGNHIMISDTIRWHNIFSTPVEIAILGGKLPVEVKGNIIAHDGNF